KLRAMNYKDHQIEVSVRCVSDGSGWMPEVFVTYSEKGRNVLKSLRNCTGTEAHRPRDWTRRGTDSFLGQVSLPGAGDDFPLQHHSTALILMGDWCGPSPIPLD